MSFKPRARWPFLVALALAATAFASVKIVDSAGSNTATVDANGNVRTSEGVSTRKTYKCTATGLATTALYSMQINAGAATGFKLTGWCVGTSVATAAALQTVTVQRRTTAASGGTAATAEGTASPAVAKMDPADANFTGTCTVTPTLGTGGAVLDGVGWTVGELGAGAADPGSPTPFCKFYGMNEAKVPSVQAGTANGISIVVSAAGAGGLASGSITATFVEE